MRLATFSVLLLALCGWLVAGPAWAAETWIDSFESYGSDAEVQAVWVPFTANVTTHLHLVGYDSAKSMKIDYANGQDPWWGNVVFEFDTPQDWSRYSRLTLRYVGMLPGDPDNSGEYLEVQIKDVDGEYLTGPSVANATKTYEWYEYSLDFTGWAFLDAVKKIEIHLPAQDYGAGHLYIDRIVIDTFPPIVDDFETYASTTELRAAWHTTPNNLIYLKETGSGDGDPYAGDKYLRSDYLDSFTPYDGLITLTFSKEQDWTAYKTLTLWYRGRDALINARQDFKVELKDSFGGYFYGPVVSNATQCTADPLYCEWEEYVMDIQGWTERGFAKEIALNILGVPDYGNGRFYVDRIELSENPPISTEPTSWGGVKAMFR